MMTIPPSGPSKPVDVSTRFERFPASLKGAFVLRGADGNPHAVRFDWANIARVPSGPDKPVPIEDRQIEVGPSRDLFVPFEVSVTELEPSWYVIRSSLQVDAGRSFGYSSRLFSIPWPRSDVRRGTFRVGAAARAGGRMFHVDLVELGPDAASVIWREDRKGAPADEPEPTVIADEPEPTVIADGAALEIIPESQGLPSARLAPGERRTVCYPVPRSTRSLQVVVKLPSGEESAPLTIHLH
jgi:hypothetical protein